MIMKLILIYVWLFFVVVESQNCKLTTTDVEGPFYEQGTDKFKNKKMVISCTPVVLKLFS